MNEKQIKALAKRNAAKAAKVKPSSQRAYDQTVEKTRKSFFATNPDAQFHKGINEFYPLPQNQIDIENSKGTVYLKQNPGYN